MQFKLSFTPESPEHLINYRQPLLLTGSCFSDHIAGYLKDHSFMVSSQPNGVVFNPISIAQQLLRIVKHESYLENDLVRKNELWHSWQHHGSFNGVDKHVVLNQMNQALGDAHKVVDENNSVVVITLGSAWVYDLTDEQSITVANCHKYPQSFFNKRLLEVNEIAGSFKPFIEAFNGSMICFTVSPVRHVRDGLVQNNLSKSILIQAVHLLCELYKERCYYFPAYEIVTDELRDYRFYNADMVHPNQQATEYVWQRFAETCMDAETKIFIKKVAELNSMRNHKIMHPETEAYRKFEAAMKLKKDELINKYGIGMNEE